MTNKNKWRELITLTKHQHHTSNGSYQLAF